MELRHVFFKLAVVIGTIGLTACQNTDFYEKVEMSANTTPPEFENGYSTGGTSGGTVSGGTYDGGGTSGGSTSGGSSSGGTSGGGTGQTVLSQLDTFIITANHTRDANILFVVDNSGSMADEQANLAANFSNFIENFVNENIRFKMAVTTTDTSTDQKSGAMTTYGTPELLNSDKVAEDVELVKSNFEMAVQVGTTGSGYERGNQAAKRFLEKNPTFVTDDAVLAVIVVSDENDQSVETAGQYADFFKQVTGGAQEGLSKYFAIVDKFDRQCCFSTSGAEKYLQTAELMNGFSYDIYSNFATQLQNISTVVTQVALGFPLSKIPVEASIQVKINGVVTNNWSYEAMSNVVTLGAGSENDNVSIIYEIAGSIVASN
jgi:hypothetical protein